MFHGADGCLSPRALCTMHQQSERCLHGKGEVKGGSLVWAQPAGRAACRDGSPSDIIRRARSLSITPACRRPFLGSGQQQPVGSVRCEEVRHL